MSSEENARLVQAAFDAWQDGTAPITDLFAPEMRWRIEGRSPIAGQYESAEQFVEQVLAPFGARFADGERFRPVTIRSVHSHGDTVIVVWDGWGVANDGEPYENSYAWIVTLRDGKVVDATAFFDSLAITDLWTRIVPD